MPTTLAITADQQQKERAVALGIVMDLSMFVSFLTVSVMGGSFTLMAESIRGGLGILLECFSYIVLRRIHRGELGDLEYGTGKLEQVANLIIGASMLLGALWIVVGALGILTGGRELGPPIGLAFAAIAGMINLYVNLIAWDSTRRAAAGGDSLIMEAQLTLRWTKLFASMVIALGLTIAALSTDEVIVAWADGLGSLFVAGYLAVTARTILRGALPDLLDRSAGESVRRAIDLALARHAGDYVRLRRVRTRRSGHAMFAEIALELDGDLTLAEVDRRVGALENSIRAEAGEVEVAIQTHVATP